MVGDSVVVNYVPAYSIVGANPAQIIKYRFDTEVIKNLLEIAWWDWSAKKITKNLEAIVCFNLIALRDAAKITTRNRI